MSDENSYPVRYSSFWPQFILMLGLTIWSAYQLYAVNIQRLAVNRQYNALAPYVVPSQNAEAKLRAIMQDLMQSAGAKNTYATQILKESIQAGILQVNKPSSTNNAPPAAAPEPAK